MADSRRARTRRDFFVYGLNFGAIVDDGAPYTQVLQIHADSDFEVQKISASIDRFGNPRISYSTVQFLDYTTNREFGNGPIPLSGVSGNGQIPFVLPSFIRLPASGLVRVTLVSEPGSLQMNARLFLIGVKVFNYD